MLMLRTISSCDSRRVLLHVRALRSEHAAQHAYKALCCDFLRLIASSQAYSLHLWLEKTSQPWIMQATEYVMRLQRCRITIRASSYEFTSLTCVHAAISSQACSATDVV